MPRSGNLLGGRTLPDAAVRAVALALDLFVEETRLNRQQVAAAFGLSPSNLSPGQLAQRGPLTLWALRRAALPEAAIRLGLDLSGFRALERLSAGVQEAIGGYVIPAESWEGSLKEACDLGMIGVELFDRDEWTAATGHLLHAWGLLSNRPAELERGSYLVTLRVGTQLADWLAYQGRPREAAGVVRRLLSLAGEYRGGKRGVWSAVGLVHKVGAVVARHQNLEHPRWAIRHGENAQRIFREQVGHPLSEVAILRDQAKPYVSWSLGWRGESPDPAKGRLALALLERAEALTENSRDSERATCEWLDTRLTRIQCLAVLNRADEAHRAYEGVWAEQRALAALASPASALRAKVVLTTLALQLADGNLDAVASDARAFSDDPTNAIFVDRVERMSAVHRAAAQGDRSQANATLLR